MHDGAADLIPELKFWNDGKGINIEAFAYAVGRYDHAVAYATVFWPDFVVYKDSVFLSQPDPANYAKWMETLNGDRSSVESMMNHKHIVDLFLSQEFEPTEELVAHLTRLLEDMWSCKLSRDFPERHMRVQASMGSGDDPYGYEVTFYEER